MPLSKETIQRLAEFFELIKKNGDYNAYELTYLAVPYTSTLSICIAVVKENGDGENTKK